jgi:hypothetical protein
MAFGSKVVSILKLLLLWSICLWTSLSIKYVFYNDFLLVKGGQISRKILYDEITQISSANDM